MTEQGRGEGAGRRSLKHLDGSLDFLLGAAGGHIEVSEEAVSRRPQRSSEMMREVRRGGGKEWIGTENRAKAGDCDLGHSLSLFLQYARESKNED